MKAKDLRDVQIVERHKPRFKRYIRSVPYTAFFPHDGQIEARLAFADAAEKAKAKEGLAEDGLPQAAHSVKEQMLGVKVAHPTPTPLKEYERRALALKTVAEVLRRLKVVA